MEKTKYRHESFYKSHIFKSLNIQYMMPLTVPPTEASFSVTPEKTGSASQSVGLGCFRLPALLEAMPVEFQTPRKTTSRPLGLKANTEYLSKTQYPGCFNYERGLKTTHLRGDSTFEEWTDSYELKYASCYIKFHKLRIPK